MALSDAVWERVWTMERGFGKGPVDFKNSLVWFDWGPFQTEQVERSTGSWLKAPARNILVDEFIMETRLPQVVELDLQVTGGVTLVVAPRMRLGHGDHRPIFAKGPLMSAGGILAHNSSGVPEVVMVMHEVMARL